MLIHVYACAKVLVIPSRALASEDPDSLGICLHISQTYSKPWASPHFIGA